MSAVDARLGEPNATGFANGANAPKSAGLRIGLLGAFPFPLAQGSQVFARDQAEALTRAGAETTLICYGRGDGGDVRGIRVVRTPRWLSPRALRSGPSPGKPVADLALAATLARAQRRSRFDVVLAHNAEAAVAALASRTITRVPVIHVAHTLMGRELARFGPSPLGPLLDATGEALDRRIAAGCDAVIALCDESAERLARYARGPVVRIPPGLDPGPAPSPARIAEVCARFRLTPGGFALYAGNLDPYQDLDLLAAAARRIPELPVVAATHAPGRAPAGLRTLRIRSAEEGRTLTFGAAVCVLARRQPGGFPIKLLNYMEAARPIVARSSASGGLVHGHSAWLLDDSSGADALANAIRSLAADRARARSLGRSARGSLERDHRWCDLAQRTLDLANAVVRESARGVSRDSPPPDSPDYLGTLKKLSRMGRS